MRGEDYVPDSFEREEHGTGDCNGSPNPDSTMESKPSIYCVLLMLQYIYGREGERNQDSKSYLDSKSSRKLRINVRETSEPYKSK